VWLPSPGRRPRQRCCAARPLRAPPWSSPPPGGVGGSRRAASPDSRTREQRRGRSRCALDPRAGPSTECGDQWWSCGSPRCAVGSAAPAPNCRPRAPPMRSYLRCWGRPTRCPRYRLRRRQRQAPSPTPRPDRHNRHSAGPSAQSRRDGRGDQPGGGARGSHWASTQDPGLGAARGLPLAWPGVPRRPGHQARHEQVPTTPTVPRLVQSRWSDQPAEQQT
jgi:hypothetical protein